jgi:hypothetical protein
MTAQQEAATAVRRSITVAAPVEKAFDVFTDRFGAWWPLDYHTGDQNPETVVIEPRRGGRHNAPVGLGTAGPPTRLVLADEMKATFESDAGWVGLLKRYADAVASSPEIRVRQSSSAVPLAKPSLIRFMTVGSARVVTSPS